MGVYFPMLVQGELKRTYSRDEAGMLRLVTPKEEGGDVGRQPVQSGLNNSGLPMCVCDVTQPKRDKFGRKHWRPTATSPNENDGIERQQPWWLFALCRPRWHRSYNPYASPVGTSSNRYIGRHSDYPVPVQIHSIPYPHHFLELFPVAKPDQSVPSKPLAFSPGPAPEYHSRPSLAISHSRMHVSQGRTSQG